MSFLDFYNTGASVEELENRIQRLEAELEERSAESGSGNVHIGTVVDFNPNTLTVDIRSFNGELYKNVSLNPAVNDYELAARKYTIPALKSPCMYTVVSSQVIYLGSFFVPNANGGVEEKDTEEKSLLDNLLMLSKEEEEMNFDDNVISRLPFDCSEAPDILPGSSLEMGPSGSKIGFFDNTYFIKLSPIFYSMWSAINDTWETMCSIFRFRSPAVDVLVDVDKEQNTNVTITHRMKVSEREKKVQPLVIKVGKDGDLIDIKIYGKPFLHVTPDRKVELEVKELKIKGKKVDLRDVDELIVNDPKNKKPGETPGSSSDEDKDKSEEDKDKSEEDKDKSEEDADSETEDLKPISSKDLEDSLGSGERLSDDGLEALKASMGEMEDTGEFMPEEEE